MLKNQKHTPLPLLKLTDIGKFHTLNLVICLV